MVRLREIPRTATFAWSPGPAAPLVATGTKAGAVDADFSNDTKLELWALQLDDDAQPVELTPVAAVSVDSRFNGIAWSQPSAQHPHGIIAGALDSGELVLWDAAKLHTAPGDAQISRITKHTGPVQAIQFNPFRPNILASAGAKGELFVHDLDDDAKSFRLGKAGASPDEYTTLDWNKKVAHILATGSSGGFVTVWDVKGKKENLTLNHFGRKTVSAIAWDPDIPTRLVTAIPSDQTPLVLVWDLRNTNAPEKTLQAHDQGVLSLSWCTQDSDLLLSCGKDNRTIAWNPHTGELLGEFPVVTNWTFQTSFNYFNPNLLATASFDGKISIQTLQNTSTAADHNKTSPQAPEGEEFFSQTHAEPQGSSFSLKKTPKWLKRRTGATFGFGGKLVRFGFVDLKSKVTISTFAIDSEISAASEEFDKALEAGNLSTICKSKVAKSVTDQEKRDWTVIEFFTSENPRGKLVEYLGFTESKEQKQEPDSDLVSVLDKRDPGAKDSNHESAIFSDHSVAEGDFLSDLAASKGAKTNNPFQVYTGSESEADTMITRALTLGNFEAALDVCLKEDRLSDAFMIAICGGGNCIKKAQAAYFQKKTGAPNYLRLLASVVGKNLWDFVYNADLKDWKEVMATICTYADQKDFPDLCEALGDRLRETNADAKYSSRKDASLCYLAGSKLEKVVVNWAEELQESEKMSVEQSTADSVFSIHARSLQDFIEKVTVFRQVTSFKDLEQEHDADWKLEPLYAKYVEYADIISAHGQLAIAEKYLELLPQRYPAANLARNRVSQATKKASPQATASARVQGMSSSQHDSRTYSPYGAPAAEAAPMRHTNLPMGSANPNSYPPRTRSYPPVNPLTQQPHVAGQPLYTPSSGSTTYTPAGAIPQPSFGGTAQQNSMGPPRNPADSPLIVPAADRGGIPAWNDTPDFGPPKASSRRGTPLNSVASPFPNQQQSLSGPTHGPFIPGARSTPPPPPKSTSQSTSRVAPPPSGYPQVGAPDLHSPPVLTGNAHAPSQPTRFAPPQQAPGQLGASPYQPPIAAAPPSNRYAPAPATQPSVSQGGMPPPNMASPSQFAPVPPPYHASPAQSTSTTMAPPRSRGPPQAPPRVGSQPTQPLMPENGPASNASPTPAAVKYPPGDRSHMSDASRRIYEVLEADMQRIKSKAPAQYKQHVMDTEKRLNILFDHLNNNEVVKADTIVELNRLASSLQAKQYDEAIAIFAALMTNKTDEGSNWMVGVKRLIQFSKSTV